MTIEISKHKLFTEEIYSFNMPNFNYWKKEINEIVKIENNGSLIQMEISNTGSGTISIPQGGGIIYPSDIELTSAFDLPDRSRKILSKANILGPDSVE